MDYVNAVYSLVGLPRENPPYLYVKWDGKIFKLFEDGSVYLTPHDDKFLEANLAFRYDFVYTNQASWVRGFKDKYYRNLELIEKYRHNDTKFVLLG